MYSVSIKSNLENSSILENLDCCESYSNLSLETANEMIASMFETIHAVGIGGEDEIVSIELSDGEITNKFEIKITCFQLTNQKTFNMLIIITDFNKFNSLEHPISTPAFNSGYWNVFKYSSKIEQFCLDNNIGYKISNYDNF